MTNKITRARKDQDRTFLTAAEVPPNLLGVQEQEVLAIQAPRFVARVGYRLAASDLISTSEHDKEAPARLFLESPAGAAACRAFLHAISGKAPGALAPDLSDLDPPIPFHAYRDLEWFVAREMVRRQRFGGPDRGVWVIQAKAGSVEAAGSLRPAHTWNQPTVGGLVTAISKRIVRLGHRYPAVYGGPDDYESGGLEGARSVVLVWARLPQGRPLLFLSGDLRPACPARCKGFLDESGAYVHTDRCRRPTSPPEGAPVDTVPE